MDRTRPREPSAERLTMWGAAVLLLGPWLTPMVGFGLSNIHIYFLAGGVIIGFWGVARLLGDVEKLEALHDNWWILREHKKPSTSSDNQVAIYRRLQECSRYDYNRLKFDISLVAGGLFNVSAAMLAILL